MKTISFLKMALPLIIPIGLTQCAFDGGSASTLDDDQKVIDNYIESTNYHSDEMLSLLNDASSIKIFNKDDTIFYEITMSFEKPIIAKQFKKDIETDKDVDLMGKFIFADSQRNRNFSKAIINKGYCVFNRIHIYPNDIIVKSGFSSEEYADIFNYVEENKEKAIKKYIRYWIKQQNKNIPIDDEYTSFKGVSFKNDDFICKYVVKSNNNYLQLKQSKEDFRNDIVSSIKQPTAAIDFVDILRECPRLSIKFIYYNPNKTDSFNFVINNSDIN